MNKNEAAQLIAELMAKYNEKRTQWVAHFGSDDGFDAWFTAAVRATANG